ncbi:MAG: hypothetical protein ACHQ50_09320 [Fimbriimonadales bacterium]
MALVTEPLKRVAWKEFGREFLKLLLSPGSILFFGLALTQSFWMGPAIYLLIKTNLIAPIGVVPWVLCILAGICFLGGLGYTLILARSNKEGRLARQCFKQGDAEGYHAHLEAFRKGRRLWPMFGAMLSVFVFLPSSIAIVLGGGTSYLVKDHGKLRNATHREEVQSTLRWIERRGIVRWVNEK